MLYMTLHFVTFLFPAAGRLENTQKMYCVLLLVWAVVVCLEAIDH